MEEFRRSYNRLCEESGAEPQEAVLQQLHQLPKGGLDLTTQSLTVETCRALGKLLHKETLLKELVLSDCMLSEEGSTLLFQGLCANTSVQHLDLKGNNLRATGAEALGKLLRQNKSIQSLTLEWNNLGTWEDAFATFCGGLAANSALRQLDLRNNQISHKGAEELALALKGNTTLQQLDLRWNNIGLLGGRALVNCLPSNRTLWKLDLAGNNIPGDILRAVEQAMDHNQDRLTAFRENQARTKILSKEVQHLQEEKSKQFLDLMETIDKQREEMARDSRPENKVIAFKQVGWQLVADVECLALDLVNPGWCGEQQLPPRLRKATWLPRDLDFLEPLLCPQGISSTGWAASGSPQREAVHHQCSQSQVAFLMELD
eukprot:XP_006533204.1 PREDICTED: leucine-rich repeat-containing protein 45 isoform X6 [Mus musculus]